MSQVRVLPSATTSKATRLTPRKDGARAGVAQLAELGFCKSHVAGSTPVTSSTRLRTGWVAGHFVVGGSRCRLVCVHMPLSIVGDASGEDGSIPSVVYV